jgi:hypothetical protein
LEVFKKPNHTTEYYLLPTTDENYSIFIGEITEENKYILEEDTNRCENFFKLYGVILNIIL